MRREAQRKSSVIPQHLGRLLIVDDDALVRRSLERYFKQRGYETEVAENAHEAIAKILRVSFDCILSDIFMPGVSGMELLRELRTHDKDVPIVLITARPESATREEALRWERTRSSPSPAPIDKLEKCVAKASRRRQELRRKSDG